MDNNIRLTLINDKKVLNERYRQGIIKSKHNVYSIGVFERDFLFNIYKIFKSDIIITSNLKANLIFLLLCPRRINFIINGFGRLHNVKLLRLIMLRLIMLRRKSRFFIQNYKYYRFLRRFSGVGSLIHLHGSGGTARKTGKLDIQDPSIRIISRKNKFRLQYENFLKLLPKLPRPITIAGLDKISDNFDGVHCVGYVKQSMIFKDCNILLHLDGYGEGFPHTLADAIVSDLPVILSKKSILEFGLYKVQIEHIGGFYDANTYAIKEKSLFTEKYITKKILDNLVYAK